MQKHSQPEVHLLESLPDALLHYLAHPVPTQINLDALPPHKVCHFNCTFITHLVPIQVQHFQFTNLLGSLQYHRQIPVNHSASSQTHYLQIWEPSHYLLEVSCRKLLEPDGSHMVQIGLQRVVDQMVILYRKGSATLPHGSEKLVLIDISDVFKLLDVFEGEHRFHFLQHFFDAGLHTSQPLFGVGEMAESLFFNFLSGSGDFFELIYWKFVEGVILYVE